MARSHSQRPARRTALAMAIGTLVCTSMATAQWVPTRSFSVREGLAQSQITDIVQGEHGYLWIATQSGLSRFDGRRFTTFTREQGLPDDLVTALGTGPKHELWIGTDSGTIASWDGRCFRAHTVSEGNRGQPISVLWPLPDGSVLVGTAHGLWSWTAEGSDNLLDEAIVDIAGDQDGAVWILGDEVHRFDEQGLHAVDTAALGAAHARLTALAPSPAGLWLGDEHGKLALIDHRGALARYEAISRTVLALLPAPSGTLWIGAADGLWRLEPDGAPIRQPLHANDPQVEIRDLLLDHENNLWIGTWSEGLHQLAPNAFMVFDRGSGMPASIVWNFHEDAEGCMWMATENAGVLRYCRSVLELHLRAGRELPPGRWIGLAGDGEGGVWMAGAAGLAHRTRSGKLSLWDSSNGLPDSYARIVHRDPGGVLWVGTRAGLAAREGRSWRVWTRADGMPDDNVRGLSNDAEGHLWIATHNAGVLHFDGEHFTRFDAEQGLPNSRVWAIATDSFQRLWAGTDDGLWVYTPGSGSSRVIGVADGLPSANILAIIEDRDGLIWASTTRGLSMLSPEGTVIRSFTAHDGLTDSEGAENALLTDSNGMLWVGLANGATRLDPRHLPDNSTAPPLVVERLLLNGTPLDEPEPLIASADVEHHPPVVCPPRTTDLRIEFAALSFTSPEKVRYRFMLDGYDRAMGPETEETRVTYRRVPPGDYTFVLTACNNDGVWTRTALELPLRISPAWYQTMWFRLSAGVFLVSLFLGALWVHTANQKRRQRLLEQEVQQRTAELARANALISEQNRQLEALSRTDPLTGLANRRVLAEQAPVEVALILRELERHPERLLAQQHGFAILVIDLDRFKRVNDEHGHDSGDRVLAAVASRIYASIREIDLAVRWGGEEFVVLARSVTRESTVSLARRLLSVIAATEVELACGAVVGLTASLGFVGYPLSYSDPLASDEWKELVDAADRFMYLAKDRGRGRAYGLVVSEEGSCELGEHEIVARIQENPLAPITGFELVEIVLDE